MKFYSKSPPPDRRHIPFYRQMTAVVLAFSMAAACPFAAAAAEQSVFTASIPQLRTQSIGPGMDNLSLGDSYATYQWGLKNDGEFQLVQMTASFRSLDSVYGARKGRSASISLPDLGPGMIEYQSTVIQAESGVDINILPAWKQYDADTRKFQKTGNGSYY